MVDATPYMEKVRFIANSVGELGRNFRISEARAADEALTEVGAIADEWFKECEAAEGETK